jgi:hypothetical protein
MQSSDQNLNVSPTKHAEKQEADSAEYRVETLPYSGVESRKP